MRVFLASLVIGFAASLLMVGEASAADTAAPSRPVADGTLARMGMGGMETVSDHEGHDIRGQGRLSFRTLNFTFIWGKPVEVRQVILIGSNGSLARPIAVSYNYSRVW